MSATTASANAFLQLLLHNVAFAGIGDAGGLRPSVAAGDLVIGLHVGDPGAGGTQSTAEAAYPGYARVAAPRGVAAWEITDNVFENLASIEFPESTAVAPEVTHFTIGTAGTGAGTILLRGKLASPVAINVGTEPRFKAGAMTGVVDTSAPA